MSGPGSSLTLACLVEGNPQPLLQWYFADDKVGTSSSCFGLMWISGTTLPLDWDLLGSLGRQTHSHHHQDLGQNLWKLLLCGQKQPWHLQKAHRGESQIQQDVVVGTISRPDRSTGGQQKQLSRAREASRDTEVFNSPGRFAMPRCI